MVSIDSSKISFTNGQSVPNFFKAFTNYVNVQSKNYADKTFARYYTNDGFKNLTYAEVDRISTNLACKWAETAKKTDVVSFISEHTINYLIAMLAILKLRVTLLAVSPRNSEAAIVNLLEKTNSKLLIANRKYEEVSTGAVAQVEDVNLIVVDPLDIDALVKEPLNPDHEKILNYNFSDDDIEKSALIIHSSGSTNFPKPIYLSNRYLFNLIACFHIKVNSRPDLKHIDGTDVFLSLTPIFHIFGFFCLFTMVTVGGTVVFLKKIPASQEEIYFGLQENKATVVCAPPLIFEQMIPFLKEKNDFSEVQRLKYAGFGGAPLRYESGQWFKRHGVNVVDMYGLTETGACMTADFDPKSDNWGSLRPFVSHPVEGQTWFEFETVDKSEPDVKHLYVKKGCPSLATGISNRADGGFDTNDLFRENPDYPGYYIYLGRRDDTLIMENGEKTNPVPMEASIRSNPMVKQVSVFGQGRQCTACLVEVNMDYAVQFDPQEIVDTVKASVKVANSDCPSHSIILPQMIKILPLNQSLPSTDKDTVKRKAAEIKYKDLIEKLYSDFLNGPTRSSAISDSSSWTAEQCEDFLIDAAVEVLSIPRPSFSNQDESVFDLGLNSLTSIQLRNRIAEQFDNVPQNFLFQHLSINSMREALMGNGAEDAATLIEKRYQQTKELTEAYIKRASTDFPVAVNNYDENKEKIVLLTGVTGSLGSFMLEDLLQDSTVKKVYCCIRGNDNQLRNRLIEAFESRSLDTSLLNSDRVEVLPMRFKDPFLGFSEEKYNQLKDEVTVVQHCAWMLDFNMPIDHFDKECIAPFYNLLKFAYKPVNPAHVYMISSISASAAAGEVVTEEPLPLDPHTAMPMGYAQSKFVCEQLFYYLTKEKKFPCIVERLGQVCGDSVNGVWNVSEQYPLMFIGGGSVMHKMPKLHTIIDWISVDYAAASITDIMLRTANSPANLDKSIFHIVNPHTIQWSDVLEAMKQAGMQFEVIEPAEWVEELQKDDSNPAYKLMGFYEDNFKQTFKMSVWETKKTAALTPIIEKSPVIDTAMFGKFLSRWQSVGFYNPSI